MKKNGKAIQAPQRVTAIVLGDQALTGIVGGEDGVIQAQGINGGGLPLSISGGGLPLSISGGGKA